MFLRLYRLIPVLLLLTLAACQPAADTTAEAEDCAPDLEQDFFADGLFDDAPTDTMRTDAEQQVAALIAQDGIHVVHFWAPWCGNSIAELEEGWRPVIDANAEVSFTFITIWNDGESGSDRLTAYNIPNRVLRLAQPDYGPSTDRSLRRRTFLDLPLHWTPTTWIFHKNGELAFAMNYGEVSTALLQQLLDATRSEWEHD